MTTQFEYDNIICLARKNGFKKIIIMRNSWGQGSWCVVNKVVVKPDWKYGYAYGHIHYSNGNKFNGAIPCAGNYSWRVIKVLDEDMEVEFIEKAKK